MMIVKQSNSSCVSMNRKPLQENYIRLLGVMSLLAFFVMAGCGGASTTQNPNMTNANVRSYTGPAPATADVRAFMTGLWENINASNKCGGCHNGRQFPNFARSDNVNLAYSDAIGVVKLNSPADSRLVSKVGGGDNGRGHNCWLDSDAACSATMTAYIERWAGGSATGTGNTTEIELFAPSVIKGVGASKNWPAMIPAEFTTVLHPLLLNYCSGCHAGSSETPQSPYFASTDINTAYSEVQSKISLDDPISSRLVIRLRDEFHNCWDNCASNATDMKNAIQTMADAITTTQVDPALVVSKALILTDGLIASGGSRYEANIIARYEFKAGEETTIYDTSGIEPSLNLTLTGTEGVDYKWVGGWGIEFITSTGKAQGSTLVSKKIHDFITSTGEYSIEAWVVPGNVTQEGPARIISYSAGINARNFTLGQSQYNYDFLHRSSTTDGNGEVALFTADADVRLQATQQHVVVTFDPINGRRIYVNGAFTGDIDTQSPGNLADWDDTFAFVLGNEASGDRPWKGKLRFVAIHNRALTDAQILQNFQADVGEKFFLLFSISDVLGIQPPPSPLPKAYGSYIMLEVSQFDSYSYLFNTPTFVNLDPATPVDGVPVEGMRIGINGREAVVGQVYRNMETSISAAKYTPSGQVLSNLGTIIALENGPNVDEFFLTFELLGTQSNVVVEASAVEVINVTYSGVTVSDVGLRTFDEINATMAELTGISPLSVSATFNTIKQQLPSEENIEAFLPSHQVAVTQLAIAYCDPLVDAEVGLPANARYFPNFNFNETFTTAFNSQAKKDQITGPLITKIIGTGLGSQPADSDVRVELEGLIDTLVLSCPACDATRTRTIVKAACATTLGSGVTLIQ